ncbi:MAG: alpha/beta hydrolase [Bacteroidales bacterium]
MISREYKLEGSDGNPFHVYEWLPDNQGAVKCVLQIAHGMAEHAGRYSDFAYFMTEHGTAVFANDHRGHGKTAGTLENVGYIGEKNGWDNMVSDMYVLNRHISEKMAGILVFMLGHSMGSFLTRKFIIGYGSSLKGAVLSGTSGNPGLLGKIGIGLTNLLMLIYPARSESKLMDNLSFGAFNKPFKPNRTKFDWLSRDKEQVDKYVQDLFCGTVFSLGFFNEMLKGLLFVSHEKNIAKTPLNLPVLLLSGEKDPVGKNGYGVEEVYRKFKKVGMQNLSIKLFIDGRHEMLNETNRNEVYTYILDWISKCMKN